MITPLLMLAIMVGPALFVRFRAGASAEEGTRAAAAVGLGLLFVFTASGHFIQTEAMSMMLPPWVPGRVALVYATGILELAIALGFFWPAYRRHAGWVCAVVLVLFFPVNIYAAIERVDMGGHAWGPVYLWLRAPLQLAILVWVVCFTIRPPWRVLPGLYQRESRTASERSG